MYITLTLSKNKISIVHITYLKKQIYELTLAHKITGFAYYPFPYQNRKSKLFTKIHFDAIYHLHIA